MPGSLTVLPQRKSGLGEFIDAMSPYLQTAFEQNMKRKWEEEQFQKQKQREAEQYALNQQREVGQYGLGQERLQQQQAAGMEQLRQLQPQAFSPYQQVPTQQGMQQIEPMRGVNIPTQYRFNQEKLSPGFKYKGGAGVAPTFEAETPDPYAQELKKSQLGLNKAYTEALGRGGADEERDLASSIPAGENPEDYILKPEMRSIRGVPKLVQVPTKKPQIPREDLVLLKDLETNMSDINSNLEFLTKNPKVKEFLGPGIVQRPGWQADVLAQIGMAPKDFSTFKSKSDLAFQKYRKWVTGVQAGLPELQWIVVDYPKPTDKPEIYISKALSVIEGMERNKETYLDYLSKNNFAVSKFKDGTQQPEQNTGQTSTGLTYTIER